MTTTIYLLRHGQYETPDHIVPYRLPGFHLSQKGIADVTAVTDMLTVRPIVAVYTSPLERTHETATILAKPFHLTPIIDERLLEVRSPAQGEKEGFVEAHGGWGIYDSPWFKEHHGETMHEVVSRMKEAIREIVHTNKGKEVIVVSHGDPIMLLVALYHETALTPDALTASHPYVPMAGGYTMVFEDDKPVRITSLKT